MCALCAERERASAEAAAAASIENARTAVAGGDDAVGNGRVASEKWRERERPSDYRSQPNTQLTAIRKLARGRVADKKTLHQMASSPALLIPIKSCFWLTTD